MADNTVTIRIDAKTDDAKKGIDQVNTSIGRMGPESQNAASHVGGLGETLKGVGKIAAGFIAASAIQSAFNGITTFASGTVKSAVGLGESLNAVNVIFKGSAQQVLDWGENNATQFGLSQRAFNELATPLGALLKNSGMGLADVAQNTIDLTKRAADMASVFNTDVADALGAINAGLRGEGNPLERYGVGLKAAAVEARALSDANKANAKDLTEEELAVARLNIIFEQTVDLHGDFVNTSKDLANATRIAGAEMEKLQAKVGAKLLPVMLELEKVKLAVASAVVDKLLPAMEQIGDALLRVKDYVVDTSKPFIDALLPAIKKVVDFIKDDFAGIGREFTISEVVTGKIVPAFKDMFEIIKDVLNFLKPLADFEMAHLQGQIEAIRGAFEVAGTAIKNVTGFLRKHEDVVAAVVAAYIAYKLVLIGGAIYTAVATGIGIMTVAMTTGLIPALISLAAKEGILTAAQVALNIAMSANPIVLIAIAIAALVAVGVLLYLNFDKITAAAGYLWDRLKEAGSGISDAWNAMVGFVTDKATALWNKIKEVGTGIYDAVVGAFTSMVEFVKTYWPEIISLILLPFFPIVALATDAFGIRTALGEAWDWIREKTSQFINSIIEFFKYLYDHSYLVSNTVDAIVKYFTDMRDSVLGIWNAVVGAIEAAWKFIYDVSSAIVKAVVGYVVGRWENLKANTTAVWDAITGAIKAAWDYIYDIVSSLAQKVVDFLSGVWDAVTAAVSTCWEIVKQIVGDAMSAVWDYVRDRLNDVLDRFKSLGGMILSALGNVGSLLYGAGRSIVMGLWNGIMSMWDSVVNTLRRLKDAAVAAAMGAIGWHGDESRPTPGGSDVPEMATGGVVMAKPGGTLVRLGEGGKDEAVIPLDSPRGAGGFKPSPKPGLGSGKVDTALVERLAALQSQITQAYLFGGMNQVSVVRARQSEMMGVVETASGQMARNLGITLPEATKIMFDTMLKQSSETQSALDKVGKEYMAAQIEAYLSGGMQQVAIVRQSQRSQQEMMDSVHDAASKMAVDLGITLPDATKIMFDRIIQQETALAGMQEQLAKDNMHAQIDAYLKGGQASVDIVKKQQGDTAIEVDKMAKDISKTFGIQMPEAITLATKSVGNITAAMIELGKQSVAMAVDLWKLGGNTAQKGAMVGVGNILAQLEAAQKSGAPTAELQKQLDEAIEKSNALAGSPAVALPYARGRDMTIPRSQGGAGAETHDLFGRPIVPDVEGMASGGVVKATPGGIIARLGEGGQDEAVIPLGRGAGSLGSTTINNYSITLSGVITDPVATGQAVADALNRASIITGPLVLSSAVRT